MSEVKVNKISPRSGTDVTLGDAADTFTIPASATLDVNGTIDVTGATVTGLSGITANQDDIALLGFKVAANGSLAKYNLVDQHIDTFTDATGIDTATSTNELLTGGYYTGTVVGVTGVGNDADCVLMLHFNGDNNATTTADTSAGGSGTKTVTFAGDAKLSTAEKKFGTSSVYFDGTGDAVNIADHTDFDFGSTSAWTIDFWMKMADHGGSNPTDMTWVSKGTWGDPYDGWWLINANFDNSRDTMMLRARNGSTASAVSLDVMATTNTGVSHDGAWHHVALVKTSSNNHKLFVNGYEHASDSSGNFADNSLSLEIGGGSFGAGYGNAAVTGYVDEFRVSDVARWSSAFNGSLPSAEWTDGVTAANADITLVSTATTAETQPTKADIVMTVTSPAAALAIGDGTNGDVRAWVSRDGGTTFTQFTLTDQGDTGGQTILTAHDLTISGQPAGTSMKYKITTHNQALSPLKETRIHAVSLGWS